LRGAFPLGFSCFDAHERGEVKQDGAALLLLSLNVRCFDDLAPSVVFSFDEVGEFAWAFTGLNRGADVGKPFLNLSSAKALDQSVMELVRRSHWVHHVGAPMPNHGAITKSLKPDSLAVGVKDN
jgi:hypothetical protein